MIRRIRFKLWVELESIKTKISNSTELPNVIIDYILLASYYPAWYIENLSWRRVIALYYKISDKCYPALSLPLLTPARKEKKRKIMSWEYEERSWYMYAHRFAGKYGWSLKVIANLNVETALALLQEILLEEQLDNEFVWGMSEIAYVYDKNTKKSKFQPLARPSWMWEVAPKIPKIKIKKSLVPVGMVVNLDEK